MTPPMASGTVIADMNWATPMMFCQTAEPPTIFTGTKIVSPGCIQTFLKALPIQMLCWFCGMNTDPSARSTYMCFLSPVRVAPPAFFSYQSRLLPGT